MSARLLLLLLTIITFTACQKETSLEIPGNAPGTDDPNNPPGNANGSEVGTWKFISMWAATSSTVEVDESGVTMKIITTSDYTTADNAGTIKFENGKMTYTDLTYSVDDTAFGEMYILGQLFDELDYPFSGTVPVTSGDAAYEKIGTDSIYLQAGAFAVPETGGSGQSTGAGYKLRWNGNQMTMKMKLEGIRDEDYQGTPVKSKYTIDAVITLEKQ